MAAMAWQASRRHGYAHAAQAHALRVGVPRRRETSRESNDPFLALESASTPPIHIPQRAHSLTNHFLVSGLIWRIEKRTVNQCCESVFLINKLIKKTLNPLRHNPYAFTEFHKVDAAVKSVYRIAFRLKIVFEKIEGQSGFRMYSPPLSVSSSDDPLKASEYFDWTPDIEIRPPCLRRYRLYSGREKGSIGLTRFPLNSFLRHGAQNSR